eukprot:CAMPEP_0113667794 /NCGR_PEP_ID=MMETSP0038_2-20120614/3639_1 /TAXON_ID=2898 /ORGANISM="Cryptomonas paramecium" /LENGTH=127 /DNA_ID=CAMNT_0000583459 /DNA_START=191 /DNA_END=571 /DNA_ORIENTATION=- /assembly_acc=CAM_ASM_000170
MGLLYQLANKPQEVCDSMYKAYVLNPNAATPDLFFHLANNLKAIGDTEAAVNFYALAIRMIPAGPVNWVLMSISLDFLGRPDLALRGYQTVLRLGPTPRIVSWVDIYMLSSMVKAGQWPRALRRYGL